VTQVSPGATWQRPKAAEWFLDERQARLPLIDVQEDVIKRLFERRGHAVERRARSQRRSRRGRDDHQPGVGGKPAGDRPGETCVQALDGVDPSQDGCRHAIGDAADRARQAGQKIPAKMPPLRRGRS